MMCSDLFAARTDVTSKSSGWKVQAKAKFTGTLLLRDCMIMAFTVLCARKFLGQYEFPRALRREYSW
jgi:hypothetical protein